MLLLGFIPTVFLVADYIFTIERFCDGEPPMLMLSERRNFTDSSLFLLYASVQFWKRVSKQSRGKESHIIESCFSSSLSPYITIVCDSQRRLFKTSTASSLQDNSHQPPMTFEKRGILVLVIQISINFIALCMSSAVTLTCLWCGRIFSGDDICV